MTVESKPRTIRVENSSLFGGLWFIGWLFTLGFAKLIWWQALLALAIWPYYLGSVLH
jgi:hypothetical protein